MRRAAIIIAMLGAGALGAQELPSGVDAHLNEVLIDEVNGEPWLRFHFVAPQLGGADAPGFDAIEADFPHLCETLALPYAAQEGLAPRRVVIALADRAVPFGETMPEATQYFEQFRVESDTCIWEGF